MKSIKRCLIWMIASASLLAPAALMVSEPVQHAKPIVLLSEKEVTCIAKNAYHEARGEPTKGIIAVIAVTSNRVLHPKFPNNACSVVYQMRNSVCQFSWYCDPRVKTPAAEKLAKFKLLVREYAHGMHKDPTHGALYYHTHKVNPSWSRRAKPTAFIHNHKFFKEL